MDTTSPHSKQSNKALIITIACFCTIAVAIVLILTYGTGQGEIFFGEPSSPQESASSPFTTVEGTVEIEHYDYNFEQNLSRTMYRLVEDSGETWTLNPTGEFTESITSGSSVKVKGLPIQDTLTFDATNTTSSGSRSGFEVLGGPEGKPGSSNNVFLGLFKVNDTPPTHTAEYYTNIVYNQQGAGDSVVEYYDEASYGKTEVTGTTFGWAPLDIPEGHCYHTAAHFFYVTQQYDDQIDFSQYDHIVMVLSKPDYCFCGMSTLGKTNLSTNDGRFKASLIIIDDAHCGNLDTITHELGHGMSAHHARFNSCEDNPFNGDCEYIEYGDHFDIMGGDMGHFNLPHKEFMGWLGKNQIKTVTKSGTYSIEPIETATSGIKGLKMTAGADTVYIEYRQPIGFDSSLIGGSNSYHGAMVHIIPFGNAYPSLLDVNPPDYWFFIEPALPVGKSIEHPSGKLTITTVSTTADALTVSIDISRR